jgi:hypothetical protein
MTLCCLVKKNDMMNTEPEELAYSYVAICNILEAKGWTDKAIEEFLIKHQNPTGYIRSSLIPN